MFLAGAGRQDIQQPGCSWFINTPDEVGPDTAVLETLTDFMRQGFRVGIQWHIVTRLVQVLLCRLLLLQIHDIQQQSPDIGVVQSAPVRGDFLLPLVPVLPAIVVDRVDGGTDIADDIIRLRQAVVCNGLFDQMAVASGYIGQGHFRPGRQRGKQRACTLRL